MTKNKPLITVSSKDTDETFRWQSDGWFDMKSRMQNPKVANALFAKAEKAIEEGKDVPDTIKLLRKAGFVVRRGPLTQGFLPWRQGLFTLEAGGRDGENRERIQ